MSKSTLGVQQMKHRISESVDQTKSIKLNQSHRQRENQRMNMRNLGLEFLRQRERDAKSQSEPD